MASASVRRGNPLLIWPGIQSNPKPNYAQVPPWIVKLIKEQLDVAMENPIVRPIIDAMRAGEVQVLNMMNIENAQLTAANTWRMTGMGNLVILPIAFVHKDLLVHIHDVQLPSYAHTMYTKVTKDDIKTPTLPRYTIVYAFGKPDRYPIPLYYTWVKGIETKYTIKPPSKMTTEKTIHFDDIDDTDCEFFIETAVYYAYIAPQDAGGGADARPPSPVALVVPAGDPSVIRNCTILGVLRPNYQQVPPWIMKMIKEEFFNAAADPIVRPIITAMSKGDVQALHVNLVVDTTLRDDNTWSHVPLGGSPSYVMFVEARLLSHFLDVRRPFSPTRVYMEVDVDYIRDAGMPLRTVLYALGRPENGPIPIFYRLQKTSPTQYEINYSSLALGHSYTVDDASITGRNTRFFIRTTTHNRIRKYLHMDVVDYDSDVEKEDVVVPDPKIKHIITLQTRMPPQFPH